MLSLANNASHMTTLQYLIIKGEVAWFARGREECLEPLLIVLQRQAQLKHLNMSYCALSDDQQRKIKSVVLEST